MQNLTTVGSGEPYLPNLSRLGRNLKLKTTWCSIEVHAIYSLFFIIGNSKEGLQVLKNFLDSDHTDIYDPLYLAQMILSPINDIVEILMNQAYNEEIYLKSDRHKINKLKVLFRFDILRSMLAILSEHGKQPDFIKKKQPFVSKIIDCPIYGKSAVHSVRNNQSLLVTGFTAVIFSVFTRFIFKMDQI